MSLQRQNKDGFQSRCQCLLDGLCFLLDTDVTVTVSPHRWKIQTLFLTYIILFGIKNNIPFQWFLQNWLYFLDRGLWGSGCLCASGIYFKTRNPISSWPVGLVGHIVSLTPKRSPVRTWHWSFFFFFSVTKKYIYFCLRFFFSFYFDFWLAFFFIFPDHLSLSSG